MTKPKIKMKLKENQIIFRLNCKSYPLEAVYSAAYIFIDRCYVHLDGDPEKEIIVSLKGKEKLTGQKLKALQGEFLNELLNYLLRVEIAKRNRKIREHIVASALISCLPESFAGSGTGSGAPDSWQDDPLGIAVPWEEKQSGPGGSRKKGKTKK